MSEKNLKENDIFDTISKIINIYVKLFKLDIKKNIADNFWKHLIISTLFLCLSMSICFLSSIILVLLLVKLFEGFLSPLSELIMSVFLTLSIFFICLLFILRQMRKNI